MRGLTTIYFEPAFRPDRNVGRLISRLGSVNFRESLFGFFGETTIAEHCGFYMLNGHQLAKCGAMSRDGSTKSRLYVDQYFAKRYWITDPTIELIDSEARSRDFFLIEVDTSAVGAVRFREDMFLSQKMLHRLLVCLRLDDGLAIMDLVRSAEYGSFAKDPLEVYSATSSVLMPLALKHCQLMNDRLNVSADIFGNLSDIEERLIGHSTSLPLRERQVAARILYGQSTVGIALDLGIGEQTVSTYRKRLYQRLQISSQQELCRWFLQAS